MRYQTYRPPHLDRNTSFLRDTFFSFSSFLGEEKEKNQKKKKKRAHNSRIYIESTPPHPYGDAYGIGGLDYQYIFCTFLV
jgi:hypothetical protein